MKMHPKLYKIFLLVPVICCFYCNAQFAFKAPLSEVKQPGFHKIMLLPSITAQSNADLSDIRIIDEYGKYVPYILETEKPLMDDKELKEFPILSIKKSADSNTQVILQSSLNNMYIQQQAAYSFVIVIKNADVYRSAAISGSDDMNKWFAISDRILLGNSQNETGDQYVQVISLPPNRYRYLNITVRDKGLSSLNIVKAGILLTKHVYGNYTQVPSPLIKQIDSNNKKSYVALHFNEAYPVARLQLVVSGPSLYRRKIVLYDTSGFKNSIISEGILHSGVDSLIVYGGKCRDMVAIVDNNDDQPLQFDKVLAFQLEQYIIADLQPGKKYFVLTGHKEAITPVYDLQYFSDSINVVAEMLKTELLQKNESISPKPVIKKGLISAVWVWFIIVIVLILLALLTYRLIKEIPQKQL